MTSLLFSSMQTDEKLDQIFSLRRLENHPAEGWECEYCITGLLLCKSLILQFPDEVIPAPPSSPTRYPTVCTPKAVGAPAPVTSGFAPFSGTTHLPL